MVEAVAIEPARARAERAHAELTEVVADCMTGSDPAEAARLLVDVVRASAELRLRAERALGKLLRLYPDAGGRPRRGAVAPMARQLREAIGTSRAHLHGLAALADVDDAAFERVVDALWSSFPTATLAPRGVAVAVAGGDPTPSIPGGESAA